VALSRNKLTKVNDGPSNHYARAKSANAKGFGHTRDEFAEECRPPTRLSGGAVSASSRNLGGKPLDT
jgi:hypothetical protein